MSDAPRRRAPRLSEVALLSESEREELRLRRLPRQPEYPLSFAQQDAWAQSRLHPSLNGGWCVQVSLSGPLDPAGFVRALQAAVDRHEALRTVFVATEGGAAQKVAEG